MPGIHIRYEFWKRSLTVTKKVLFSLWGGLFIVCAGLGFIPEPSGVLRGLLTGFSVLFFVPPALLLYRAKKEQDDGPRLLVRNLSALSLLLTLILLVLNFLTALGSETLGRFLYSVLVIASSPMVCSGCWALSLFLWACLLMASLKKK